VREGVALTFVDKVRRDGFAFLGPTHETDGDRDTLTSEKTLVVRVCDGPDLTQDVGAEVGSTKDANGDIAGDNTKLLGVVLVEYLVYESELPLCWGEG
jgi:hypothetical protein